MKRTKKIFAWAGLVILAVLYLTTFILGLFGSPATHDLFMACIVCTVVVPVLLYAMILLMKLLENRHEPAGNDHMPDPEDPVK